VKKIATIVSFIMASSESMFAQKPQVFVKEGAAMHGYDPVAHLSTPFISFFIFTGLKELLITVT
jgi:hypothetical protein